MSTIPRNRMPARPGARAIAPLLVALVSASFGLSASFGVSAAPAAAEPPRVLSGGVTAEEFKALDAQSRAHALKLLMVARHSGAFLGDVKVSVFALPDRRLVLQQRSEGPLMLLDLPPGRYEIRGEYEDVLPGSPSMVRSTVTVRPQTTAQAILAFQTGDTVNPDQEHVLR